MEKRKTCVLLAAACALQLFVAAGVCTSALRIRRDAVRAGRVIVLECTAYDPYHPFKGRYIRLDFPAATVEAAALDSRSTDEFPEVRGTEMGSPLYCCMECGADGLWHITGVRRNAFPQPGRGEGGAVCVKAKARLRLRLASGGVAVNFPFAEYYLQENFARHVDSLRADEFNALRPQLSVYVDRRGNCVQQGLTVAYGGSRISIEDYCKTALHPPAAARAEP